RTGGPRVSRWAPKRRRLRQRRRGRFTSGRTRRAGRSLCSAPARSRGSGRGATTHGVLMMHTSRGGLVPASPPAACRTRCAHRLPTLADRMVTGPLDAIAQIDPVIILIDAPTSDVSSTAVRQLRASGATIAGLVPPAVERHIEQHGLYTAPVPGRRASDVVK